MKVLHVITGLSASGAENALYNLLQGGLAARADHHIISLTDEGAVGPRIRALGVPVTALGMRKSLPSVRGVVQLRRTVRAFLPDVIQGWMYHGNLAALLARFRANGRPALAWNVRHSLYDLAYEKPMMRQVIRTNRWLSPAPQAVLYNSRLSRKQHRAFGFSSRNARIIPNGVNLRRFAYSPEAGRRVRSELGIPGDAPIVGHVARLHPMKDHANFLRAAASLAARHPEVHFLLSGIDVVWENKALAELVPEEMQGRFHMLGERSDVPDLMSAMDVFCLSSWAEAFPNVLGEAMATGVPCVATDVGDSADIVDDTGVVVPPRDANALVDGIERLLMMPPEGRRVLGAAARARVQANYELGIVVEQYERLYESLSFKG